MSVPIILVASCMRDKANGRQQAVEETWMREWGDQIDHRFLLGRGEGPLSTKDLLIPVSDDYYGVPHKFMIGRAWALDKGYTHVFHACIDTWINVPALLASGYENHEYTGYRCAEGHGSGGMGYWLGPNALDVLLNQTIPHNVYEDLWVGAVLRSAGIPLFEDRRYSSPANLNRPDDEITLHLSQGTNNYDPQWMRDYHKKFLETGHV